ncbi:MAG: FAD binding domain-containing protein [Ignavibacteriales bacterium]|nr:FAD binding domain-containing protein [Ignavibacteriales bacterium]
MSYSLNFICNNEEIQTSINPATVVLDFLRKHQKLTGTKEGCREGDCGACAILVGEPVNGGMKYRTVNSCLLPILAVNGKHIVSIEGLNSAKLNPIQQAIVDEGATQCGFCTPGFIISITGYFLSNKKINYDAAINYISGNICRCTGYTSIKNAVKKIFEALNSKQQLNENTIEKLISLGVVPEYFSEIPSRLRELNSTLLMERITGLSEVFVGGGTDLFVQKPEQLLKSKIIIENDQEQNQEQDISGIRLIGDNIILDSRTTISEFQNSEIIKKYFPEMEVQLNLFGSPQIRNRATIGGNIINASPIGDMTNILISLGAVLNLSDGETERNIAIKDFYLGYKNLDKKEEEFLKSIVIPIPKGNYKFNFEKISRRTYLDIASVNTTIYIEVNENTIADVRLSAGGVAPFPFYLKNTCKCLLGKEINYSIVREAAAIAQTEISPISDVRGSAEYKSLLLHQLIIAHFIKLFPSLIDLEEIV